jgi:hypothetical protein
VILTDQFTHFDMTLSFPKLRFTLSVWLSNSYECFNQNNRLVIETEDVLYLSHISDTLLFYREAAGWGEARGRRKFLKTLLKAVNVVGKYVPYHTSLGIQDEGRNGIEVMYFRQSRYHTYKLDSCRREI